MDIFIYDACSLIYLTKINIKEKLVFLGSVKICKSVKNELTSELEKFSDARRLKENLDKNIIEVSRYKTTGRRIPGNIGKGEYESIALCLEIDALFVTDDHQALNIALNTGLKPKTSEIILIDLLKKKIINYESFKVYFLELAQIKSLKPEIVLFFNEKAREIENNEI